MRWDTCEDTRPRRGLVSSAVRVREREEPMPSVLPPGGRGRVAGKEGQWQLEVYIRFILERGSVS